MPGILTQDRMETDTATVPVGVDVTGLLSVAAVWTFVATAVLQSVRLDLNHGMRSLLMGLQGKNVMIVG